eukprot:143061-Pyramimonas_sp.AAC.1
MQQQQHYPAIPQYPQYPRHVQYPNVQQYPQYNNGQYNSGPEVPMMHYAPAPQIMDQELEEYVPLQDKVYDVTNMQEQICGFIWCPCCGLQTTKLMMDDQEVLLKTRNACFSNTQRRPYAQLGSVDMITTACGCYTLISDFAPVTEDGKGGLTPGCGCDGEKVTEIVRELQDRQRKRGGVAQVLPASLCGLRVHSPQTRAFSQVVLTTKRMCCVGAKAGTHVQQSHPPGAAIASSAPEARHQLHPQGSCDR